MCIISFNNLKLGPLNPNDLSTSNVQNCTQQLEIKSAYSQMTLIPSNVHNCAQQIQIKSSKPQITLIPSNMYNCSQQSSNHILLLSNDLDTLKYAQVHSSNSNHHSIASNMHSSITNTHINIYNLQICTWTPPVLGSPNLEAPTDALNMHQHTSNTKHLKKSSEH